MLSRAMTKVAGGDLAVRVPVTSNDEVGELTGQFNTMVEGLREREQHPRDLRPLCRRERRRHHPAPPGPGRARGRDRRGHHPVHRHRGLHHHRRVPGAGRAGGALNDYLETVLAPIREHGGVVNTFIGDGLFASFNMPLACEGHAAAAVRAALDIQRAVGSRTFGDQGVALATRIGISTGP